MIARLTSLFPVWALLFAFIAYQRPAWFADLAGGIVPLLGVVMFAMGMTLTPRNFLTVAQRPRIVLLGLALQFALMPALAWMIGVALRLDAALLVGLVLVGSCPGGTASNVVCYLARGDVALSITLTSLSTLASVVATPLLTWLYVGQRVPVPVADMMVSVLLVVIVPVLAGLAVNSFWGARLYSLKRVLPLLSVFAICLIIAIIVALQRNALVVLAAPVLAAVVLHNAAGLACGYGIAGLLGVQEQARRTLAIEVGMQNSGLAVALASQFFSASAALPGALFSIWHNLSGSLLAARWSRHSRSTPERPASVP